MKLSISNIAWDKEQDKDVFKKLLTSNEFFASYQYSVEGAKKRIENDRAIYKFYLSKLKGKKSFSKSEGNKLKKGFGWFVLTMGVCIILKEII